MRPSFVSSTQIFMENDIILIMNEVSQQSIPAISLQNRLC